MIRSHPRRKLVTIVLASATALATTSALAMAATPAPAAQPGESARAEQATRTTGGNVDARKGLGDRGRTAVQRAASRAINRPATKQLTRSLGAAAIVDIDGNTGTPRRVAARGGFLTGRSSAPASSIALGYVRSHAAALGLADSDLGTFRLRRDYVDIDGIHHLSFAQVIRGYTVFGNGLQAAVTRDGRLLMLGGSPVPSSLVEAPAAARLTAGQALTRASGETIAPSSQDLASKVLFVTRGTTYLGWRTVSMSADQPAVSVVDAATGRVVYRNPIVTHETAERAKPKPKATGLAFRYHPKAKHGGKYETFNFTKKGWLPGRATILKGNNAHAYSDVNDNDTAQKSEEVGPKRGHSWNYRLVPFHIASISWCDNPYPCSWRPNKPFSWKTNRAQNTTQVFYFVNQFHDYLKAQPFGFTEAAGNFQARNRSGKGEAGDAVVTQTLDGANTSSTVPGLPDGSHIDNANMATPPDGIAPRMQMYLQHQPFKSYPDEDPFPANNTGDQGDTVYHEYTHGLSHRLVVDAGGNSTLGPVQGDAMGEGWSDWYAFDYLVAKGLHIDKPATGDVRLGVYDGAGAALVRTQALDCPVGPTAAADCINQDTGYVGGYTYADYAQVIGGPEVHADGEIWAQTLWDLRNELGHFKSAKLVTRGMELAPENPSYLDMRDSILLADTAVYGGADETAIWQVFADRGMGYFAGSLSGDDTAPSADFTTPPATLEFANITGTVTDSETGDPIQGATVTLPFQGGGAPVNPSATTAADGSYTISAVVGSYPKLSVSGPGYEPESQPVDVVATTGAAADFQIRRDWAASTGGGSVVDFDGPDFTPFGCGPGESIDLSLATGWSSITGEFEEPTNVFVPKDIVIELPAAVDVSAVAIDPTNTCGDGGSASMGDYQVWTSTNGTDFTSVATGTFTVDDRGQLNEIPVATANTGVTHVRVWMDSNQTPDFVTNCPDGAFSGCVYTDITEIAVYGSPSP